MASPPSQSLLWELKCNNIIKDMMKFPGMASSMFYCSQQKERKKLICSRIEFASLSLTAKMTRDKWSIGRLRYGMCGVVTGNGGRGRVWEGVKFGEPWGNIFLVRVRNFRYHSSVLYRYVCVFVCGWEESRAEHERRVLVPYTRSWVTVIKR